MTAEYKTRLNKLFKGVVAKKLTLVETITEKSNQHEFQGTLPLRRLFGNEDKKGIPANFIWLGGNEEVLTEAGFVSWSNVRKARNRSAEYHLYYSGNAVTEAMLPGDMLFLALGSDDRVFVIIAQDGSNSLNQLLWLFNIPEEQTSGFVYHAVDEASFGLHQFAVRTITAELGIDVDVSDQDDYSEITSKFKLRFPGTRMFSELARSLVKNANPLEEPDNTLISWLVQEEKLFRFMEKDVVATRLKQGFYDGNEPDVDAFIKFSLSVQNRRKSRAGHSLENHLEAIFLAHELAFVRGAETESWNKPDFLFPSQEKYRDTSFPSRKLSMLGAKSTLKDRWRQVITEADRITNKHLFTLEPSISKQQTDQIKSANIQLVLPIVLHSTFKAEQKPDLISLESFISIVKERAKN